MVDVHSICPVDCPSQADTKEDRQKLDSPLLSLGVVFSLSLAIGLILINRDVGNALIKEEQVKQILDKYGITAPK